MILSKLYWKPALSAVIYIIFYINNILGQPKDFPDDWVNGRPESCTVVLVGRNASPNSWNSARTLSLSQII